MFLAIAVLALAGMVVSAVSLQRHYAKSASAFCDFGERFNCDIVNRSEYSSVMGIPVAAIGVAGLRSAVCAGHCLPLANETPFGCWSRPLAGLVFALYLTYIEGHVLDTWCILCLSSLGLIAMITVLACVLKAACPKQRAEAR